MLRCNDGCGDFHDTAAERSACERETRQATAVAAAIENARAAGIAEGRRQMREEVIAASKRIREAVAWQTREHKLSSAQRARAQRFVDGVDAVITAIEAIPVRKDET